MYIIYLFTFSNKKTFEPIHFPVLVNDVNAVSKTVAMETLQRQWRCSITNHNTNYFHHWAVNLSKIY